jgi:CheY-like chemotaxis protein
MMPDMDGLEVFRRLKENRVLRAIPVIFLTALSSMEAEAAGLALGAAQGGGKKAEAA